MTRCSFHIRISVESDDWLCELWVCLDEAACTPPPPIETGPVTSSIELKPV